MIKSRSVSKLMTRDFSVSSPFSSSHKVSALVNSLSNAATRVETDLVSSSYVGASSWVDMLFVIG